MGIKFIPTNQEVIAVGEEAYRSEISGLLRTLIDGIHRVEKQLEKVTEEPLDEDERRLR